MRFSCSSGWALQIFWKELRTPRPATETRDGLTKTCPKIGPWPEILDSQNLPPKIPENTQDILPNTKNDRFGHFYGNFGYFLGVQISAQGVFLDIVSGNSRSGNLCAVAVRCVLKERWAWKNIPRNGSWNLNFWRIFFCWVFWPEGSVLLIGV